MNTIAFILTLWALSATIAWASASYWARRWREAYWRSRRDTARRVDQAQAEIREAKAETRQVLDLPVALVCFNAAEASALQRDAIPKNEDVEVFAMRDNPIGRHFRAVVFTPRALYAGACTPRLKETWTCRVVK